MDCKIIDRANKRLAKQHEELGAERLRRIRAESDATIFEQRASGLEKERDELRTMLAHVNALLETERRSFCDKLDLKSAALRAECKRAREIEIGLAAKTAVFQEALRTVTGLRRERDQLREDYRRVADRLECLMGRESRLREGIEWMLSRATAPVSAGLRMAGIVRYAKELLEESDD